MKRIRRDKIQEGDIAVCRNEMRGTRSYNEAKAIRFAIMSWSNHNSMVAKKQGQWGFAEAVSPVSKWTALEEYEGRMVKGYRVRIYRLKNASAQERTAMAHYFMAKLIGLPYPRKTKMALLGSRFVNSLPFRVFYHIKNWCTYLVFEAVRAILHNALDGPEGKQKRYPTPKTIENRIIQGLFVDITDDVIEKS